MTGTTATDTAERVRALRQHYRLSQTALAQLLDVTRQTVTNWERGYPMSRIARYALVHLDQRLAEHIPPEHIDQ
jgi:DNA-binding transcriptional regulator YiaG